MLKQNAVSISSGGRHIVTSGCIFTFEKQPIIIDMFLANVVQEKKALTVKIEFLSDESDSSPHLKLDASETATITVKLFNFKNSFGNGTKEPIEIATSPNSKVYMQFHVRFIGESVYIMEYTIYEQEVV